MGRVNNLDILEGMSIRNLSVVENEKGSVLHMIRSDSEYFEKFGEIYFSEVMPNVIKGWKKHKITTQNFVVPVGRIKLVLYDQRQDSGTSEMVFETELGRNNYKMITIPPQIWYGFQGLSNDVSIIANLIDNPHDPEESESLDISDTTIPYNW
tara:strand:- start:769 stop:1227 length:459 start_codon:yes stop_codon:yes gene_type:complete